MEQNSIIKDIDVLTEEFIPSRILHRDSQLSSLKSNLSPLLTEGKPRHCFLYGPPGTGKTTLANYVAGELKAQIPLKHAYINCWESNTRFSIIYSALKGFGAFVQRKGTPTDELLELFRQKSQGPCLIVLDEVDRLEEHEVFYDIIQSRAGLIMISNSHAALHGADPRIRSRLASTENIQFHPYSGSELFDILADRREWGLVPGALSNQQIEKIALLAGGDARTALGILSNSAQKAESQDLKKIPDSLLEESMPLLMSDSRKQTLEALTPHQKLVLDLLSKGERDSGELFSLLEKECKSRSIEKIAERTFRKIMEKLVHHGMVSLEGEGRWRTYSLNSDK